MVFRTSIKALLEQDPNRGRMFHHAAMLADLKQFMSDSIFIGKQIILLLLFSKLTISALYFNEYFNRSSAFKIPSRTTMSDTK